MNPLFHTEFSISDSLKNVRKSVLIYETIILESVRKVTKKYHGSVVIEPGTQKFTIKIVLCDLPEKLQITS